MARRLGRSAAILALVLALGAAPTQAAGAAGPKPPAEAKKACAKYKKKAKELDGKAKRKALKKYKRCLRKHDQPDPPPDLDPPPVDPPSDLDPNPDPPPPTDPKDVAQSLIENQEFFRVFAGSYSSGEDLIRFCDGTWFRRYTSQGQTTTSESYGNGTWSITNAQQGTTAEGDIGYVASVAIQGTYDSLPADGNMLVAVSPQTSQSAIDLGDGVKEYIRRDLGGSC